MEKLRKKRVCKLCYILILIFMPMCVFLCCFVCYNRIKRWVGEVNDYEVGIEGKGKMICNIRGICEYIYREKWTDNYDIYMHIVTYMQDKRISIYYCLLVTTCKRVFFKKTCKSCFSFFSFLRILLCLFTK
jgi:hypothetical protein